MFNFLKKNKIRVRIAPSPTGYLHIGTARTALFNWLFAKKNGGKFILRIEDTDLERSEKRFEDDIIGGLKWLGLNWDEGPYRQSERLDIYEKHLKQLLKEKKAYYCDCTKEELEKERESQFKKNEPTKYSGHCREKNVLPEKAELIRFKIGSGKVFFTDLIRGEISFDSDLIGDIAIAKNLRTPLYNFAVVIDDYEMKISHVIRGEDHIANTPKQILIGRALNFSEPKYGHLPLILDPDRSKMSKRYSATSIKEYKEQGYLPESLINFIVLLGWHPDGDKEIMPIQEIINKFDLKRIQKGGAIFDLQKLDWLNSRYIKEKSGKELMEKLGELYGEGLFKDKNKGLKIVEIGKQRVNKLSEFKEIQDSFLLGDYDNNLLIWKNTPAEKILENLRTVKEMARTLLESEFDKNRLESYLMPFANTVGRGEVFWPVRVALAGKDKSAGPFEIMEVLGKDESLRRLEIAINKLENRKK